jgi:transcriptional regulator with XRE-family HTH domain
MYFCQRIQFISENVNLLFGKNLRALCIESGTFSDAARHLDMNRVQLARYMRGESFPKPNQLERICQHFHVDARIFTRSLAELQGAPEQLASPSCDPLVPETLRRYAEQPMIFDDGIHLVYRKSFTFPDLFVVGPLLVRRHNRVTWLRGLEPPPLGRTRRQNGPFQDRSYGGFALSTPDGFLMYFHGTGKVPFLSVAHFGLSGFFSATGYFRGTHELHRPMLAGEERRVPIVMEPLRQKASVVLAALRRTGICRTDQLPEQIRSSLTQSPSG